MNTFWAVLLIVLAVGATIGTVVAVRRRQYIKSLEAQGWIFDNSPTLAASYGLNCPPFGVGFKRSIDDLITGTTTQGVPFKVFEYGSLGYVAALSLSRPLPELYIAEAPRPGVSGQQKTFGAWTVTATDPAWAEAAVALLGASVDAMAAAHPVNLSVDGASLVALGVPRDAARLRSFLDALAAVAVQLGDQRLSSYAGPPPPSELSLYQRPSWIYRPHDDRFLDQVVRSGGGYGHAAQDVVLAETHGIRMIGLRHTWKTDRTETSTDANGNTSTRTVTDHHSEDILEFHLPWRFGDLSVNWTGWGDRVRFESSNFDREFKVRCAQPKFASDVFHPRQMEFMLRTRPLPFAIKSGRVRFAVKANDPALMEQCSAFLIAFLAGVPSFVWEDLGQPEPPISRDLDGF